MAVYPDLIHQRLHASVFDFMSPLLCASELSVLCEWLKRPHAFEYILSVDNSSLMVKKVGMRVNETYLLMNC